MRHRRFAPLLLAMAAGFFLAGAAAASAAQAVTALNVRAQPGVGNPVVDVLYAGEQVNVRQCTSIPSTWCYITHTGPDGWVSAAYLRDGPAPAPQPRVDFWFGNPSFSFSFGNPPRQSRDRVCFYENANYRGRSFCADEGDRDARLSSYWDDRISSIRIFGNARVRICEDRNYRGRCVSHSTSRPTLPAFDDRISSYRVY
ncbi:MAG TPA: SH3 domain-containing protein [Devosiaceae bacterium]|nr:SH3 domain-containing protein [Devosiaceae bacterium]